MCAATRLTADLLYTACPASGIPIDTTADAPAAPVVVGQDRAVQHGDVQSIGGVNALVDARLRAFAARARHTGDGRAHASQPE